MTKFKTGRFDINGTSLQGYVHTTYAKLKEIFGEPVYRGDDKVTAEWVVKTADGIVATIYDWKEDETPLHSYEWHIGGHDVLSVEVIREIFESAGIHANVRMGW